MLVKNPSQRITAIEALNDDWIKNYFTTNAALEKKGVISLERIRTFKVKNQLQQEVLIHLAKHGQSKKKIEEMKAIFHALDKDGNGVLDAKELQQGYVKMGKTAKKASQIVDRLLKKIDVNNNGLVDYTEFLMANLEEEVISKSKLRETFKLFDKVD